jgi:hypothetical protein
MYVGPDGMPAMPFYSFMVSSFCQGHCPSLHSRVLPKRITPYIKDGMGEEELQNESGRKKGQLLDHG